MHDAVRGRTAQDDRVLRRGAQEGAEGCSADPTGEKGGVDMAAERITLTMLHTGSPSTTSTTFSIIIIIIIFLELDYFNFIAYSSCAPSLKPYIVTTIRVHAYDSSHTTKTHANYADFSA